MWIDNLKHNRHKQNFGHYYNLDINVIIINFLDVMILVLNLSIL